MNQSKYRTRLRIVTVLAAVLMTLVSVAGPAAGQPTNDDFANAQVVKIGTTVEGTVADATNERGEPFSECGDNFEKKSVWYRVAISEATGLEVTLDWAGSVGPVVSIFEGSQLSELQEIDCGSPSLAAVTPERTYYIRVQVPESHQHTFTLTLRKVATTTTDAFASAQVVRLDEPTSGSTLGATREEGEPVSRCADGREVDAGTAWYQFVAPSSGSIEIFSGTPWALFSGTELATLTEHVCSSERGWEPVAVEAGMRYYLQVWAYEHYVGPFTLRVRDASPPPNDAFASASLIGDIPRTISGSTTYATREENEPSVCGTSVAKSVWYRIRLAREMPVEIRSTAKALGLFQGAELSRLTRYDCSDPSASRARVGFSAEPGKTYYLQVGSPRESTAHEFSLTIRRFDEPEPFPRAAPPCRAKNFRLLGFRLKPRTTWHLNAASVPSYLKRADVVRAIKDALRNIAGSENDCGMADKVGITARYGGTTTRPASTCDGGRDDGLHVIEFSSRMDEIDYSDPNGLACTKVDGSDVDIWMNRASGIFTVDPFTTLCRSKTPRSDLEGLLTHELGHAYGLGHPGGSPNLTMSGDALSSCSGAWRTFGRGDVLGLRQLY